MPSAKWRPFCFNLNVSKQQPFTQFGPIIAYRQVSNIRRTLVGNKTVDHSDVVGASPVGAAPTTSSFSTSHLASLDWAKTTARREEKHLILGIWCILYLRFYGNQIQHNFTLCKSQNYIRLWTKHKNTPHISPSWTNHMVSIVFWRNMIILMAWCKTAVTPVL